MMRERAIVLEVDQEEKVLFSIFKDLCIKEM